MFSSNVDLTRSDTRWDGTVGLDQKMAAYCGIGEACAGTSFFSSKKMSTYRFLFFFMMSDTRKKNSFFSAQFQIEFKLDHKNHCFHIPRALRSPWPQNSGKSS